MGAMRGQDAAREAGESSVLRKPGVLGQLPVNRTTAPPVRVTAAGAYPEGDDTGLARMAFEAAPKPIALIEIGSADEPRLLCANRSLSTFLSRDEQQVVARELADQIRSRSGGVGSVSHRPRSDEASVVTVSFCRTDGSELALELHAAPVSSQPDLYALQIEDVTARNRREREATDTVHQLQAILDNSSALIFVKGTDGRYLFINAAFERHVGLSRDKVCGRTDFEVFERDIATAYIKNDSTVMETRSAIEAEEPSFESQRSWLSIKFPLLDGNGRLYALGGICTDITDRKQAEAFADAARQEAERANTAKSEFLSRMSHELRTPLNAILGFGELLALEQLPAEAADSVEHILKAGLHLLALINEVLQIARIEAGHQQLHLERVHACDPVQDVVGLLRPLAREHGVVLDTDMHEGLHQYVLADYQRLKQVMLNLITNAIKYNRVDGVVRVHYKVTAPGRLRFLVTDTGPGIDESDMGRLFVPFERLAADHTDIEGTGLGLALSKSLVESMGGRIAVQHTAPGQGSTFYVDLPMTSPPEAATVTTVDDPSQPRVEIPPVGAATILYVEDNLLNLELVTRILKRVGPVRLIPAMQGMLGLELAVQHSPDLILLDLHLPDLSGYEVFRRLKSDRRTRHIPVIVLSADATTQPIERLRRQGKLDYLTKPFTVGLFIETIRAALASRDHG